MFIDGKNYTNFQNVNVKDGAFRFGKALDAAMDASGTMAIYVRGTSLYFWNGSSETQIGAAGSGGVTTFDALYDSDKTLALDDGVLTFTVSTAADGLYINKTNSGAGVPLVIGNSGSGYDIQGPAWSIISTGSVGIVELASGGTINATSGACTIGSSGTTTTFAGAATITQALTVTGGGGSTYVTVTAGDVVITDGSIALTDADNAETFTLINNTASTIGASASAGVLQVESTSLTTGALINAQCTEATLDGGFYYSAWDMTGGTRVFSVGEDGAIVLAGAGANNILTITAGDAVMSDGSLTITDADNAATVSITNNTATTASVFVLAGSGAFTGTTTGSFATITASGLTSGTGIYAPFAALTTGKGVHITSGATQTTGSLLYVQDTGANCALTSGTIASFDATATAITGTVNKIGSGVSITSSRTTTTGTVSDNFDLLSIIRTDIINGAGSMASAGSVLYVENAVTNTSGTVSDTTNGIEIVMDALGTGAGVSITHAAPTGTGAVITNNALTTGAGLSLATSATGITTTGRIFLSTHSGNAGVSATLNEFISAAADETTVLQVKASAALAAGKIVNVSGASMTTGTALAIADLNALTTGSAINVTSNSADATARSLVYIKNDHASAVGTIPLAIVQDSPATAHFYAAIKVNSNTIWVGDGTTANGTLSGTAGDILINGGASKIEFCTGTTNWTATT